MSPSSIASHFQLPTIPEAAESLESGKSPSAPTKGKKRFRENHQPEASEVSRYFGSYRALQDLASLKLDLCAWVDKNSVAIRSMVEKNNFESKIPTSWTNLDEIAEFTPSKYKHVNEASISHSNPQADTHQGSVDHHYNDDDDDDPIPPEYQYHQQRSTAGRSKSNVPA
ncbi:hypothetical protein UCRPC4_g06791 [Phaeomoniella chlamydospora]|uniref:Uncharacterized protein n=1 Tax=Phaeomoniella chlamydospora TaxID=158046 RepID=A0A0G2DW18_PHACM|nr:hypothetical protein UCRPC4_g06791 [Phaeomoniella chlamydospora]